MRAIVITMANGEEEEEEEEEGGLRITIRTRRG